MDIKVEKSKTVAKLKISVEPKELVEFFNDAYNKLAPGIKIDGFRPGKAPRTITEAAIGHSRLLSEAIDLAINSSYFKTVVEHKLNVVSAPKIVINKYPNFGLTAEEIGAALEYEAEVEFIAEVKLKDYSNIQVEQSEPQKATEEDVEKVLNHFKKQAATFIDKEGAAEKGDHAEINFEGMLKKVRIDAMCSKNHPIIIGENTLIPGFEDHIVGMKVGEKKEFKIKFPKDYHGKEYADKEAEFKIELIALKTIQYPEVDDIFAEKFGHKNPQELKAAIKKNLEEEYKYEFKHQIETKVLDKALPLLEAEIPQALIEKETARMLSEYAGQLQKQGLDFERYISSMKKTSEELKKDMTPQAEKNIKVGLLLGKIIEELKLDPNKQENAQKALDHLIKIATKK